MKCPHCNSALMHSASGRGALVGLPELRNKRTDTEAQEQRILAALRAGPKTTDDLRRLGIYQASARIFGLRKRGYEVDTDLFDGVSADGYSHARMARYTLRAEPEQAPGEGEGPVCG